MFDTLPPRFALKAAQGPSPAKGKLKIGRDNSYIGLAFDQPVQINVVLRSGEKLEVDYCPELGPLDAANYNLLKNYPHRAEDQQLRAELVEIFEEQVDPDFRTLLRENERGAIEYEKSEQTISNRISPLSKKGRANGAAYLSSPPPRLPFPTSAPNMKTTNGSSPTTEKIEEECDAFEFHEDERMETDSDSLMSIDSEI